MLLVVSSASPAASAGSIIYVDQAAVGGDGSSWANAFTDLQDALDIASSGAEVRVAEGIYRPHSADRTVSFSLIDGVTMSGGFQTGGVAGPDPALYETVLSGDLAANDLPGFANNGENSYHVVSGDSSVTAAAVVDGFTVTAGNANGTAPQDSGGGVHNKGASPTIRSMKIVGNAAYFGGGIYNENSTGLLIDSTVSSNDASQGGGVFNTNSDVAIMSIRISNNRASTIRGPGGQGGGLYNANSSPTVTNSVVADNRAASGGGIYNSSGSAPSIIDTTIVGNEASDGAGMYSSSSTPLVSDSDVLLNRGTTGAGVYNETSDAEFIRVRIIGNVATQDKGGGMYNDNSNPIVADSTISNNQADDGGGMFNIESSPTIVGTTISTNVASSFLGTPGDGGGIYNTTGSSPTITDSSIGFNTAQFGAGIFNKLGSSPTISDTSISDNVGNQGGGVHNVDSDPTFRNTAIDRNGGGGIWNDNSSPTIVASSISSNSGVTAGAGIHNRNASSPWIINTTIAANSANNFGGGIYNYFNSSPTIVNTTITGNNSGSGEGGGMFNTFGSSPLIVNTTITANSGGIRNDGGNLVLVNSIVWPDGFTGGSTPTVNFSNVAGWTGPGIGNIDADPLFASPGNYRLQGTSPAREAGDDGAVVADTFDVDGDGNTTEPTPDLDGRDRVAGIVDMGTYEMPLPSITPGGVVIAEGTGGTSFWGLPVTLSAPAAVPVAIDWNTADIAANPLDAHPGSDFVAASGTLTFAPGETVKNISLEIIGDAVDEPPLLWGEWGIVTFTNPRFATLDTNYFLGLGLFIIIDDD
jgi:hypothetical protein